MAKQDFIDQLRSSGYDVEILENNKVAFKYVIPVGRLASQQIRLGFLVQNDFPANPPSGPHVSPRLLPLNPQGGSHPNCGVHESGEFGSDWEYWSRPFTDWGKTDHSVRTYMAFVRHLFDTL
jgi:hypothetical protein